MTSPLPRGAETPAAAAAAVAAAAVPSDADAAAAPLGQPVVDDVTSPRLKSWR